MRKLIKIALIFGYILSLAGCGFLGFASEPTAPPDTDSEDAEKALVDFFQLLHDGDYEGAAALYSGSYEWLADSNPDIPAADLAALLERGCRQNGLTCLEALRAEQLPSSSPNLYIFQVEFQLEDGSLFILGPCCGADETEMPPMSVFQFQVLQVEDGTWKVTDLPPFVP